MATPGPRMSTTCGPRRFAHMACRSTNTRRDVNTSLAIALTYYQSSWDAAVLPFIIDMGHCAALAGTARKAKSRPALASAVDQSLLRANPRPGLSRFHSANTRACRNWATPGRLPLAALAFDLSGDATYLTQHLCAARPISQAVLSRQGRSLRLVRRRAGTRSGRIGPT